MVRRLADWREDEARRLNRPMRQVLRDDLLVAIAKRQPRNRRELEALRDFNRPALLNRSQEILAILEEARAAPEDQLPDLAIRHEEPPGLSTVTNLLSAALAQCCAQNQIAGSIVANVADLKELVRWYVDGRDQARPPSLLQGWRAGFCGQLLLDVIEGRFALRVIEPGSEFPVAVERVAPRFDQAQRNRRAKNTGGPIMHRILSCFTNCYGAAGVWTAVERIKETGLDHLELALRGHNFGGLVIPESVVITEKADDATAQAFCTHLERHHVKVSGCNVGGADIRTHDGFELTQRRIRVRRTLVPPEHLCLGRRSAGRRTRAADDRRPSAPAR